MAVSKSFGRGEPLVFPEPSRPVLAGWLSKPSLGRIVGKRVVEFPLSDGKQTHTFCGEDADAGLTVKRRQRTEADGVDVSWQAKTTRTLPQISLRQTVELDLPWTSYVIAPGAVYNGNRFLVSAQPYAPFIPTEGVGPDGPILINDVPRVTSDTGYRVELAANAFANPFLGIFDPQSGRGVLVEFQVYGEWGVSGVTVTTLPGEPIAVAMTLPVQRVRRYRSCDWVDAREPGMDFAAGETLEARFRVIPVKAPNTVAFVSELSKRAFAARDRRVIPARSDLGRKLRAAGDLVEAKWDKHNWDEQGFYRGARLDEKTMWVLQSGWAGGATTMRGMLQSPDLKRRARARRMLEFLCTAAAPSGYFYGYWNGKCWRSFGVKRPGCRSFCFVRRPLEVGRDLLFAMELFEARGESIKPGWVDLARRFLEAVVKTEQEFGHLGYSLDPETGEVMWGDSCGGVFALEEIGRAHV